LLQPAACGMLMEMTSIDLRDARGLAVRHPLATAFALSLIVHVCFFGFWRVGKQLGWWQHQATWLLNWPKKSVTKRRYLKFPEPPAIRQPEVRLTFVEVDPSVPPQEAPKDAKFYGTKSTRAANPDETITTEMPKIDGKQDKVMRTENVPKPKPFPLQPAVEKANDEKEAEPKPKSLDTPGDLAKAKTPTDSVDLGRGEAEKRQRPRTLEEARNRNQLAGEKTKVDSGTKIRGRVSLDVKVTPFSSYDAAFIAAVQQRWYDLLDSSQFAQHSGKVVLEFRLTYDGRITDLKVSDNEVGEILSLLCQRAIRPPARKARSPDDMRRMIGGNYREVTFTFFYN
jgi:hypothetical protein